VGEDGVVFEEQIEVGDASICTRHRGGDGLPTPLLHGHPRTSSTWHRAAPLLAARGIPVVCAGLRVCGSAGLRGYGRSRGPAPVADHVPHSKRTVAADMLAVPAST
jgi:haloacetate dehalogenase